MILRAAFALDQCGRGVELIDRHGCAWLPDPGDPSADETHVLVGWFLWQSGRIADARAIADRMPAGRGRQIADTLIALADRARPAAVPRALGDAVRPARRPADPTGVPARPARGARRPRTIRPLVHDSRGPWVIATLRATGRLDAAMAMYEHRRESPQPVWLHAVDAVDLMLDLGRVEEAWAALECGRTLVASTGSKVLHNISLLAEAKLWLRLKRDTRRADRVLAEAATNEERATMP